MKKLLNQASTRYFLSSVHFTLCGLVGLPLISLSANAANDVAPLYADIHIAGDRNKLTADDGHRDIVPGSSINMPQSVVGNNNTLHNVISSHITGSENSITKAKVIVHGDRNKISGTNGQVLGDYNTVNTGDNAYILGSNNIVTGAEARVFGNSTNVSGARSIALGDVAHVSSYNSVSLGHGAKNDRDWTVSVGSQHFQRQITNVKAGTEANDAVNVSQLNAAMKSANAYTDSVASKTSSDANAYTDKIGTQTLSEAKEYTNQVGGQVLTEAKEHANDVGDQTLAEAKAHTNQVGNQVLGEANKHTDVAVAGEAAQREAGDASALHTANNYTDIREVAIRADMTSGTSETLNSANYYTDQRFDELSEALDGAYAYMRKENQKMRREYRTIGALAMASSSIGIAPRDIGRSQFGMAVAGVEGESALAVGLNYYVNDSTVTTLRGAVGTSKAVTGISAGIVKGW